MAKKDFPPQGAPSQEKVDPLEQILAGSSVPEEYRNFVRGLTGLSSAERKSRIAEMAGVNADFAEPETQNSIRLFFDSYDQAVPRRDSSAEAPVNEAPSSQQEAEPLSSMRGAAKAAADRLAKKRNLEASQGPGAVGGTGARGRERNPRVSLKYEGYQMGDIVMAKRSDGSVEYDWQFMHQRLDTGEIVLRKKTDEGKIIEKEISPSDFDETQKLPKPSAEQPVDVQSATKAEVAPSPIEEKEAVAPAAKEQEPVAAEPAREPQSESETAPAARPEVAPKKYTKGEYHPDLKKILVQGGIPKEYWSFASTYADRDEGDYSGYFGEEIRRFEQGWAVSKEDADKIKAIKPIFREAANLIRQRGEEKYLSADDLNKASEKGRDPWSGSEIRPTSDTSVSKPESSPEVPVAKPAAESQPTENRGEFWSAKYKEWSNVFADISIDVPEKKLREYASSMGFDENAVFPAVDKLISLLDSHEELPLKKYKLSIQTNVTFVGKGDEIFLSLPDIMKKGPEAMAEFLISEISKNEGIVPVVEKPGVSAKSGTPEGTVSAEEREVGTLRTYFYGKVAEWEPVFEKLKISLSIDDQTQDVLLSSGNESVGAFSGRFGSLLTVLEDPSVIPADGLDGYVLSITDKHTDVSVSNSSKTIEIGLEVLLKSFDAGGQSVASIAKTIAEQIKNESSVSAEKPKTPEAEQKPAASGRVERKGESPELIAARVEYVNRAKAYQTYIENRGQGAGGDLLALGAARDAYMSALAAERSRRLNLSSRGVSRDERGNDVTMSEAARMALEKFNSEEEQILEKLGMPEQAAKVSGETAEAGPAPQAAPAGESTTRQTERGPEAAIPSLEAARDAYVKAYGEYNEKYGRQTGNILNIGGDNSALTAARAVYDAALRAAAEAGKQEILRDARVGEQGGDEAFQSRVRKALVEEFVIDEEKMLAEMKASRELPPLEKTWYEKVWMTYNQLPQWQKVAISSAIGAGVALGAGAIAGTALTGAWAGGWALRRASSLGASSFMGATTVHGVTLWDKTFGRKKTKEYKIEELTGSAGNVSQNLENLASEYQRILEEQAHREEKQMYLKAAIAAIAGAATSIGFGAAFAHDVPASATSGAGHAAPSGAPHTGPVVSSPEHIAPADVKVDQGSSLWKTVEGQLKGKNPDFDHLTPEQQTYVVSSLTHDEIRNLGLQTPDHLPAGFKIDPNVFNDDHLKNVLEQARHLTAGQEQSIAANNAAILQEHQAYPHEQMTTGRVAQIISEREHPAPLPQVETPSTNAVIPEHAVASVPLAAHDMLVTAAAPENLTPAGFEHSLQNWSVDSAQGGQLLDRMPDLSHAAPTDVNHLLATAAQKVGDSHPLNINPADTVAVANRLKDYMVAYPAAHQAGFSNYGQWAGVKDVDVKKFLDQTNIAPRAGDIRSALQHSWFHRGAHIQEFSNGKLHNVPMTESHLTLGMALRDAKASGNMTVGDYVANNPAMGDGVIARVKAQLDSILHATVQGSKSINSNDILNR